MVEIDTAYFRFSDGSTDTTQSINVVLTNGVGIGSSSFYLNSLTNLGHAHPCGDRHSRSGMKTQMQLLLPARRNYQRRC